MQFTVGMASYDDVIRTELTVMDLLIHHNEHVGEIIVVNNHPEHEQDATKLRNFCNKAMRVHPHGKKVAVRYIDMATPKGTASPRNRVFAEASFDHTVCVDPHVFLYPNALKSLGGFYETRGRDCPDLVHGPLMTESGLVYGDHMNYQWRSHMLGTWGRLWIAPRTGRLFSVMNPWGNELRYVTLDEKTDNGKFQRDLDHSEILEMGLDIDLGWAGHEARLLAMGARWSMQCDDHFIYEVPGHGMGTFACRTDAWLPFPEAHRGFGSEEITTDLFFREQGRKCWTLNGFRWWHHFERDRVPYRIFVWDKVRNYVLAFDRLKEQHDFIDELYQHFVGEHLPGRTQGSMPENEWTDLMNGVNWPVRRVEASGKPYANYVPPPVDIPPTDPNRRYVKTDKGWVRASGLGEAVVDMSELAPPEKVFVFPPKPTTPDFIPKSGCGGAGKTIGDASLTSLGTFYEQAKSTPSDINEHLITLSHLAMSCSPDNGPGRVVELQVRNAHTTAAFLMGSPTALTSYDRKMPMPAYVLNRMVPPGVTHRMIEVEPLQHDIPECDLLFLDPDDHGAQRIWDELVRHSPKVKRYIVLHDTVTYGEKYNDGPGTMPGVRSFLRHHPEWTTVRHDLNNNGLLVLSRDDRDKQQPPGVLRKALSFAKAVYGHATTGRQITPQDVYAERIDICMTCPKRWHDVCGECGCAIETKAGWADQECGMKPEHGPKKWLALTVIKKE